MKYLPKNVPNLKLNNLKVYNNSSKKKNSYKIIQMFSINFKNIRLNSSKIKIENSINLNSYKELVKSFLIKNGNSKQLQTRTLKSLLHLWYYYPELSLKKNINAFFFLYPFPIDVKTSFPIFRKRRSKRGIEKLQWLNTTKERKYIFNFFKDFFNKELKRGFNKIFVLTFLRLASKRVSLLKKHRELSKKFEKRWKPLYRFIQWRTLPNYKLNKKNAIRIKKKKVLYSIEKRFKFKKILNTVLKGSFLDLNFLPTFIKKKLWGSNFFINIKFPSDFFLTKSLIFSFNKYKVSSIKNYRRTLKVKKNRRKKFFRKWAYFKWKSKVKFKAQYHLIQAKFEKLRWIKEQRKLFYKWLKYSVKKFGKRTLFLRNKEIVKKNYWINKDLPYSSLNTSSNKLYYSFLNNKYFFIRTHLPASKKIIWYFIKKKCLVVTLLTHDRKALKTIEDFLSKNYTTFLKLDSVILKTSPLKKSIKRSTLLKSPHVNKKAQQHFSKIEYKKDYFFYFDSKLVSVQTLHIILHRLISINFVNLKFKIKYGYN